jgi:hypothetical protein
MLGLRSSVSLVKARSSAAGMDGNMCGKFGFVHFLNFIQNKYQFHINIKIYDVFLSGLKFLRASKLRVTIFFLQSCELHLIMSIECYGLTGILIHLVGPTT